MNKFFEKYPFLKYLGLVMLLICAAFAGYYASYIYQNYKHQMAYEELADRAFRSEIIDNEEQAVSINSKEELASVKNLLEEHDPFDKELFEQRLAVFLATVDNAEYYEEYAREKKPDLSIYIDENSDVKGYLLVPDSNISYPILRSEKDDYYLKHNLDGTKGYPGCLYVESCNSETLDDPLTIIYGHDMDNDTMFGGLNDYINEKYRNEHKYFFVYTEDEVRIYEVCICSTVPERHLLYDDFYVDGYDNLRFAGFSGNEPANLYEYVKDYKALSMYVADEPLTVGDRCVVLSTCFQTKTRYIVVGKRVV